MRTKLLVAALILLLVLAACGDDDDDDGAASTTSSSTTTTEAGGPGTSTGGTAAGEEPVGDPSTDQVTSPDFPGENEVALLTDVRVAGHDGFDRIVFEFEGDAAPAFDVSYVEPPITEDPSDEPIEVGGAAFLRIVMSAASGVDLGGDAPRPTYTGPDRLDGPGSPVVELVGAGDFEAVLTWVAGVDAERRFGVTRLSSPTRVVVDVVGE